MDHSNEVSSTLYLNLTRQDELTRLVKANGWIEHHDVVVRIEKPGEGNMNFVARVVTSDSSLIVKQSRPWVEKYPQITAPVRRIFVEAAFYQALQQNPFYHRYTPAIIGFDGKNYLMALEDLGESSDYTSLYQRGSKLGSDELAGLMAFISQLHQTTWKGRTTFPANLTLRKLNSTHIFHYPYLVENGFNLDNVQPGLQAMAMAYKTDKILKRKLRELGNQYLSRGPSLLHGDYYPGSWLKTKTGVKVIDPEFAHLGKPEFDLGVMMAHFRISRLGHLTASAWEQYRPQQSFDRNLLVRFAAAEIMRRLIGLAQLPLTLELSEKELLLKEASQSILDPRRHQLF